jgi:polysaccharide export outer membrane protein
MKRQLLLAGMVLLLVSQGLAQEQSTPDRASSDSTFNERYPRYRVGAGDVFDITFEFSPEFNQTATVQPDGFVTLRGIGDVHVSGSTIPQLTTMLQNAFEKILFEPKISLLLKDFQKPYFTVTGQVQRPGKYDLRGETTVGEAIAVAGGFTEKSKHSHVVLFRRVSSEWTEARVLDVKKMFNSGNLSEDLVLRPGDLVFIPQNNLSKISRFIPNTGISTYLGPNSF